MDIEDPSRLLDYLEASILLSNGSKYLKLFQDANITANDMQFLQESDLIKLGIDDPEFCQKFLIQCNNVKREVDNYGVKEMNTQVRIGYTMDILASADAKLKKIEAMLQRAKSLNNLQVANSPPFEMSKKISEHCCNTLLEELCLFYTTIALDDSISKCLKNKKGKKKKWRIVSEISAIALIFGAAIYKFYH